MKREWNQSVGLRFALTDLGNTQIDWGILLEKNQQLRFQWLPFDVLLAKLPRLVLEVCTALRSKDSDCREIARETLAKMAASLGENHLALILKHLATILTEGYQLHVRSATLHSVLLSLSKVYNVTVTSEVSNTNSLPFDQCIPAIMDLIMQDLFGTASEMKEVEYVEKRLVKEA